MFQTLECTIPDSEVQWSVVLGFIILPRHEPAGRGPLEVLEEGLRIAIERLEKNTGITRIEAAPTSLVDADHYGGGKLETPASDKSETIAKDLSSEDDPSQSYSERERLFYTGVFVSLVELPVFAALQHYFPAILSSGVFEGAGTIVRTPMLSVVVIFALVFLSSPLRVWLLYRFATGKRSAQSLYRYILLVLLALLPPAFMPVLGPFLGSLPAQIEGETLFPMAILFLMIFILAWIASDAKRRNESYE